jgi:hydrogenase maturation protease
MGELGKRVDSVLMHQLTIDFAEVIAGYDQVVFVDACLGADSEELRVVTLEPCMKGGSVTLHHLPPGSLLSMSQALYGKAPSSATLVSIKGSDFDFGEGLSPPTQRWADEAVDRIWDMVMGEGADSA